MKLLRSIGRELTLLSRSYYFYIEIAMAALYLVLLLVVMPENMIARSAEYYYFDMPQATSEMLKTEMLAGEGVARTDTVVRSRGSDLAAVHFRTEMRDIYVVDSEDALIALSQDTGNLGLRISLHGGSLSYHYYLQGHETTRLRNLLTLASASDLSQMLAVAARQTVRRLPHDAAPLTDRQNLLSILLVVNSVLMGIFVMAAYIFEDKKTNIINATRVTPTSVSYYLLAKMCAVLLTSFVSAMVVTVPVMGANANYILLGTIILSAGFLAIATGSFLASFFRDMEGAFVALYIALIILLIPSFAVMLPTWNPPWLTLIPSYWAIVGTQSALLRTASDVTLLYSSGFLLSGIVIFWLTLDRYKNKEASGL